MQKLKQPAIKGIQIHNQREKESQTNPDIDETKLHLNYDLVNSEPIDYNEKVNAMIEEGVTTGRAIRKDAVRVASFLVTSDKEFFDGLSVNEEKRFFKTAYQYLADEYGKDNIAYAAVHKDEKTPHMHVGFVPITEDGRLSAKDFFGKRLQLVQLQDKFHNHMKEAGFDLDRGVSSDRKHIETARFKAETLDKEVKNLEGKLEKTLHEIKKITEHTKKIEDIPDPKKAFGQVMMKTEDHETLKNYAIEGTLTKIENARLIAELQEIRQENTSLKSELQTSQDRVRSHYKTIEIENQELKENFDQVVKVKLLKQIEGVQKDFQIKYNELVHKHNNLLDKSKNILKAKDENIEEIKIERDKFQKEKESYQKENSILKDGYKKLSNDFDKLKSEFAYFREITSRVLDKFVDRIKTWLMVKDVDQRILRELVQNKEMLKEKAFDYAKKDLKKERQPQKEQELER